MSRKLVFVVESNDRACREARELVESLGYEVIAVGDVEAALAVFQYSRADVVLTAYPLPLPEKPEREFATFVKREAPRTLLLGMVASVSDARKSLLAGCDGFLAKPLDPELLEVQLRQMVGAPGGRPTAEH
jgi:two-component system cell cycle response regulator DivK